MPDGTPDLQGIWTGGTLTPFERPAQLGTQLPESARAEHQRTATEKFWAAGHKPGEVGRDNDAFIDQDLKILPNGQTSLVVEPADGKVPLRPEAAQRRDFNQNSFDSYETMSQWDRCITREPTTMFPVVYNNAYQIVQTPGYVLIVAEMIHDARIIPISRDGAARSTSIRACARGAAIHAVTGKARRWSSRPRTSTRAAGSQPARMRCRCAACRTASSCRSSSASRASSRDTMQYEIAIDDPRELHRAVEDRVSARARRRVPDVRIRVPRGQSRDRADTARRARAGAGALRTSGSRC